MSDIRVVGTNNARRLEIGAERNNELGLRPIANRLRRRPRPNSSIGNRLRVRIRCCRTRRDHGPEQKGSQRKCDHHRLEQIHMYDVERPWCIKLNRRENYQSEPVRDQKGRRQSDAAQPASCARTRGMATRQRGTGPRRSRRRNPRRSSNGYVFVEQVVRLATNRRIEPPEHPAHRGSEGRVVSRQVRLRLRVQRIERDEQREETKNIDPRRSAENVC